jgi:hypothetical protein
MARKPAATKAARPARKAAARNSKAPAGKAARRSSQAQVTVRHYCQGIGDCHLLKFTKSDGSLYWMMIDCGIHTSVKNGSATVGRIVDDVLAITKGKLDVIVATHEHADHLSGFSSASKAFEKFDVGEIWMGWTEDPADKQAQALDKYKEQAVSALQATEQALNGNGRVNGYLGMVRNGLTPLLQFQFGAKGDKVRDMRKNLVKLVARSKLRYLEPKDRPITIPGLPNLRIYVLGPPRDPNLIKIVERKSEMYGLAGAGSPVAQAMLNGFAVRKGKLDISDDYAAPFDGKVGARLSGLTDLKHKRRHKRALDRLAPDLAALVSNHYLGAGQSWRRIDHDWLSAGAGLGMQLDAKTNNTSLVLAFEFVDSGRVMLFTGDAQVGNWLGWQSLKWKVADKTVTGPDLLGRTVYYKVGHHGSENATLKQKGLELMKQADFSAFIPTNQKDAKNVGWGAMPFKSILKDLEKHASGRVIRADDKWVASTAVDKRFLKPSGAILGVRHQPKLWVELDIA